MSELPVDPFTDVHLLIERSRPRPRIAWFGYAVGLMLLVALGGAYISSRSPGLSDIADTFSKFAFVIIMLGLALVSSLVVRRQRNEIRLTDTLEELVQLRRWPQAAELSEKMLSTPMRTPQARAQVLILLAGIRARFGRFADAITIQTHLLETIRFDDATASGLALGRAMAMLREDHLVDADRAISQLRRSTGSRGSAGLALVQLYRDVKTGHPHEAIEHFTASLPLFRQQLGHRAADAYALVARAYDQIGQPAEAQSAYEKATLLAAPVELSRRYPEISPLEAKYPPAPVPQGLSMGVA